MYGPQKRFHSVRSSRGLSYHIFLSEDRPTATALARLFLCSMCLIIIIGHQPTQHKMMATTYAQWCISPVFWLTIIEESNSHLIEYFSSICFQIPKLFVSTKSYFDQIDWLIVRLFGARFPQVYHFPMVGSSFQTGSWQDRWVQMGTKSDYGGIHTVPEGQRLL